MHGKPRTLRLTGLSLPHRECCKSLDGYLKDGHPRACVRLHRGYSVQPETKRRKLPLRREEQTAPRGALHVASRDHRACVLLGARGDVPRLPLGVREGYDKGSKNTRLG